MTLSSYRGDGWQPIKIKKGYESSMPQSLNENDFSLQGLYL